MYVHGAVSARIRFCRGKEAFARLSLKMIARSELGRTVELRILESCMLRRALRFFCILVRKEMRIPLDLEEHFFVLNSSNRR